MARTGVDLRYVEVAGEVGVVVAIIREVEVEVVVVVVVVVAVVVAVAVAVAVGRARCSAGRSTAGRLAPSQR